MFAGDCTVVSDFVRGAFGVAVKVRAKSVSNQTEEKGPCGD